MFLIEHHKLEALPDILIDRCLDTRTESYIAKNHESKLYFSRSHQFLLVITFKRENTAYDYYLLRNTPESPWARLFYLWNGKFSSADCRMEWLLNKLQNNTLTLPVTITINVDCSQCDYCSKYTKSRDTHTYFCGKHGETIAYPTSQHCSYFSRGD